MEPVNITNENELGALDKRISIGPLTLVLVYADWCGHCQTFKPIMDQLENTPGRTIQTARIRDDMFPKSSLQDVPIEGYPSLLLVKNTGEPVKFEKENGEVTTVLPEHKNVPQMTAIVKNAGTPEGLNILSTASSPVTPVTIANAATPSNKSANQKVNSGFNIASLMGTPSKTNEQPTQGPLGETIGTAQRSPDSVNTFSPFKVSANVTPPDVSVDRVNLSTQPLTQSPAKQQVGGSSGGGLFEVLSKVAYQYGPAVAYLWAANALGKRRGKKTRRRT